MPYFDNFGASNKPTLPDAQETPTYAFLGKVVRVYNDYFEGERKVFPPGSIEVVQVSTGYSAIVPAHPLDELSNTIPIINELVDVYTMAPFYFYRRRNYSATINNSLKPDTDESNPFASVLPSTNTVDYKTGASSTSSPQSVFEKTNFKNEYINRLKYYEGDSLYQSRFGQSIRFSGYNNGSGNPHPTIIIRNRQADKTNTRGGYKAVEEDINEDGSTIAVTSGEYKSEFLPGRLVPKPEQEKGLFGKKKKATKGESDFYIKPWTTEKAWAFAGYPKELTGDQIVITSDRLILSSRANEMMFFSKGNMGIFADTTFSIDARENILMLAHDKSNIVMQAEGEVGVYANKGVVLGSPVGGPAEGVLKGQSLAEELAKILTEMLDGLKNGKVYTPAGPTGGIDPIWAKTIADKCKALTEKSVSKNVFVN